MLIHLALCVFFPKHAIKVSFQSFLGLLHLCDVVDLQVPSAYFLTDVFLRFDQLNDRKVFRPTAATPDRLTLAANEGVKTKRLIGSLRALWRSSKVNGQDDRITELKSFLLPSPRRDTKEAENGPAVDEGQEERPERIEEEEREDGADSSASSPASGDVSEHGEVADSEEEAEQEPGSESEDSLAAPTLKLDGTRAEDSSSDPGSSPAKTTNESSESEMEDDPVIEDAYHDPFAGSEATGRGEKGDAHLERSLRHQGGLVQGVHGSYRW